MSDVRLTTASLSDGRHDEWSELGSRDIDHTTRGARARERDAIESIRPLADQRSEGCVLTINLPSSTPIVLIRFQKVAFSLFFCSSS